MTQKVLNFSTEILWEDLPISGSAKGQCESLRYFTAGEIGWKIEWFSSRVENTTGGYCSLYLHQKSMVFLTIQVCCTLMKDGKVIRMLKDSFTYSDTNGWGWPKIAKTDDLLDCKISIKLQVMSCGLHIQRLCLLGYKQIVQTLEKDVKMVSGKVSASANSAVLRYHSPVFSAMLNLEHGFVESQEKSILLQEGCEKSLEDMLNFFYEGDVENLEISNEAHYSKFYALITLADKYKVDSLLEYIRFKLSNDPCELDIFNRLCLISKFKHVTNFKDTGELLMMWANKNLSQINFLELMKKIMFTMRDDEL